MNDFSKRIKLDINLAQQFPFYKLYAIGYFDNFANIIDLALLVSWWK